MSLPGFSWRFSAEDAVSAKRETFARTPIAGLDADKVPGIGRGLAARLAAHDEPITTAEQLLGAFLLCNRDADRFGEWLDVVTGGKALPKHKADCAGGLAEWCENHL